MSCLERRFFERSLDQRARYHLTLRLIEMCATPQKWGQARVSHRSWRFWLLFNQDLVKCGLRHSHIALSILFTRTLIRGDLPALG